MQKVRFIVISLSRASVVACKYHISTDGNDFRRPRTDKESWLVITTKMERLVDDDGWEMKGRKACVSHTLLVTSFPLGWSSSDFLSPLRFPLEF